MISLLETEFGPFLYRTYRKYNWERNVKDLLEKKLHVIFNQKSEITSILQLKEKIYDTPDRSLSCKYS